MIPPDAQRAMSKRGGSKTVEVKGSPRGLRVTTGSGGLSDRQSRGRPTVVWRRCLPAVVGMQAAEAGRLFLALSGDIVNAFCVTAWQGEKLSEIHRTSRTGMTL
jgi:hypothetical protein